MNSARLITVAVAVAVLLVSIPAVAYAEPNNPYDWAVTGVEPWDAYKIETNVVAEHGPVYDVGAYDPRRLESISSASIAPSAHVLSADELNYYRDTTEHMSQPSTIKNTEAERLNEYFDRIEAAASTAPAAPAYDVKAYLERIDAAAATAPAAPVWNVQASKTRSEPASMPPVPSREWVGGGSKY